MNKNRWQHRGGSAVDQFLKDTFLALLVIVIFFAFSWISYAFCDQNEGIIPHIRLAKLFSVLTAEKITIGISAGFPLAYGLTLTTI